jgi:glutamine---fructose-6-phosphate transaminase (isomerizing)
VCGIVGYVGKRDATSVLIEGLHRLEYRGYDSAGLAVISRGRLQVTKTAGRVQDLRDKLATKTAGSANSSKATATTGIGHTRWATHGEPNETNAHPHTDSTNRIAVVHNGIIENAELLRDQLQVSGVHLASDTDTEALAHMIAAELAADDSATLEDAVIRTLRKVEGAYGLVVLDTKNPDQLVVARNGSPIVLGLGNGEMFVASDVSALVRYTKQVIYLEDGEVATIKATDYHTTTVTASGTEDSSIRTTTTNSASSATTCARKSTSSPKRSAVRCAAASKSGSPRPGSVASTWTLAS